MKIVQLIGQIQCQLEDGSTAVITTPPLVPDENLTTEAVREKLMSLGENARSVKPNRIVKPSPTDYSNLQL